MQMCLNWKVLAGLAVIAVLIGIAAPQFFFGALPVLLVLACPISMLFMMGQMGRMRDTSRSGGTSCPACQEEPGEVPQEPEQPLVIERTSSRLPLKR